jgi:hypothetical protein
MPKMTKRQAKVIAGTRTTRLPSSSNREQAILKSLAVWVDSKGSKFKSPSDSFVHCAMCTVRRAVFLVIRMACGSFNLEYHTEQGVA